MENYLKIALYPKPKYAVLLDPLILGELCIACNFFDSLLAAVFIFKCTNKYHRKQIPIFSSLPIWVAGMFLSYVTLKISMWYV